MTLQQQCVACNVMIPDTRSTCSCGHVFQSMKRIGGKRFSGYREQLYTRLETKRMKTLTRKDKIPLSRNEETQLHSVRKKCNKQSEVIQLISAQADHVPNVRERKLSHEPKPKKLRHKFSATLNSTSFPRNEPNPVPVEWLADNLPKALAEINKRLLGQNRMWTSL